MALTAHDIATNADLFRVAYPNWPHPEPTPAAVTIGGRLYGLDDAVAASAVLAEHDAGRTQAASGLARMARLDGLDRNGLEALCSAYGVEVCPLDTLEGQP